MTNKIKTRKLSGFTLIELLVVISIIGLLASVVLVSLNTARAKARDAKRRTDLKQISTALALYFNDNSSYPSTGGAAIWWGNCSGWGSHPTSGATGWVPNLAPMYMPVLPVDPKPPSSGQCYLYGSDGIDYKLIAIDTVESTVLSNDPMIDPARPTRNCYSIYTPGAMGW